MNNKKPSKSNLPWLDEAFSSLALWITQFSPIASTKQIASSNASQQHQNLTLHSEWVWYVFWLSTSQGFGYGEVGVEKNYNGLGRGLWVWQNMWVMWVYIVWVKRWCIKYDKIAKQNVLQVSRGKALPAKYSRKPAVTICHDSLHSSHGLNTWLHFAGRLLTSYPLNLPWSSMLPWVFTLFLTYNSYNEIPHKI